MLREPRWKRKRKFSKSFFGRPPFDDADADQGQSAGGRPPCPCPWPSLRIVFSNASCLSGLFLFSNRAPSRVSRCKTSKSTDDPLSPASDLPQPAVTDARDESRLMPLGGQEPDASPPLIDQAKQHTETPLPHQPLIECRREGDEAAGRMSTFG